MSSTSCKEQDDNISSHFFIPPRENIKFKSEISWVSIAVFSFDSEKALGFFFFFPWWQDIYIHCEWWEPFQKRLPAFSCLGLDVKFSRLKPTHAQCHILRTVLRSGPGPGSWGLKPGVTGFWENPLLAQRPKTERVSKGSSPRPGHASWGTPRWGVSPSQEGILQACEHCPAFTRFLSVDGPVVPAAVVGVCEDTPRAKKRDTFRWISRVCGVAQLCLCILGRKYCGHIQRKKANCSFSRKQLW